MTGQSLETYLAMPRLERDSWTDAWRQMHSR